MSHFASPDQPRPDGTEASSTAHTDAAESRPAGVVTDDLFGPSPEDPSPEEIAAEAPRAERPVPPRRRLGAGVAVLSLLLGVGGGVAGSAAWDAWGPSTQTLPSASEVIRTSGGMASVADVAQAVTPSVVQIEPVVGGLTTSFGSGLVIREDGYILTNNHVVESSDGDVNVLFSDGEVVPGEIVGRSPDYDLAVVRVDRDGLTPLTLGDSDALLVGDPVIAIGSPLGLDSTVTAGIVSALGRPVVTGQEDGDAYIAAVQTDAAINPGNSGGPLLNAEGEVVGINSAVAALPGATQATGAGSVGLGFAVPSNVARRVAEEIIATGEAQVPVIGVLLDSRYTGTGIRVLTAEEIDGTTPGVVPGSPADLAGVREGDIIVAIDGQPAADSNTAIVRLRAKAPGDEVTFTIERDGERREVTLELVAESEIDFGDVGDE